MRRRMLQNISFLIMYRMCLIAIVISILNIDFNAGTPLDDYVNTPDPNFSWKLLKTYTNPTYSMFILNMTSQKWLNCLFWERIKKEFRLINASDVFFLASFSSQPIWWHYMIITVPKPLKHPQTAFLLIQGGHNTDP